MSKKIENLTPQQIVNELDKYIIGQKEAKRNVAIALRNRWRRMNASPEMVAEIIPNNILMIGSTGVGKTEIARRLAKIADAPFVKVEASKFTEVGYVGRDCESMVRDLVEQSVNMVKLAKKEEVKAKALDVVEDNLLDILIPPVKDKKETGFVIEEDKKEIEEYTESLLNEKTREAFRTKLRNGELDHRKIEIDIQSSSMPNIGVMGGPIDDMSMLNIQEMLGGMMPKKGKKRKLTIAEARKILLDEEASKLIDMDEVKEEAIWKAENLGIIFIDEIDKIASTGKSGGGADVSREGVQRDLLPIVEGSAVNTKHGTIKTDHILFVAAGAFHVSKPSDLIPELQGRFPIRVELESLTEDNFYQILKAPKNALTKQYIAMLEAEGVNLIFEDDALREIAKIAFEANSEVENIGARRLQTVMSHLLNEIMFDVPDNIISSSSITITKELVSLRLSGLVKNRDLSQYIL
ncbi:ATP-dependent hsl protease ATP-binding subunit hslU [Emticicia oligotrophica DSM 17448]|uniref:ATP-dependent protease ATPase subunit HslU n=1 Tax=Emticicia oligotrophica (strain DSM 17448 / CIP 109782 / MTCC 6937 / GPTSA100-15) TaxID=929562 RepID=A0ABM5MXJ4_EMTOG|nr:ATP-dependent protease ATPase subunit HslU [Emticicia oligotrophica]AFK01859.1 ATP-dependent hsl protease ATP-binding subunit hslU [Emticicia oligotrophica DSM 17448]